MQACEGYLIDGRFTPDEKITLPSRVKAVLVFDEAQAWKRNEAEDFWAEFDRLTTSAVNEEMPDFPRMQYERELVMFSNEE